MNVRKMRRTARLLNDLHADRRARGLCVGFVNHYGRWNESSFRTPATRDSFIALMAARGVTVTVLPARAS